MFAFLKTLCRKNRVPGIRKASIGVEILESRNLMSAAPLAITGTAAADTILLRHYAPNPAQMEVVVNSTSMGHFDASTVSSVKITALAGDDIIKIDYTLANVPVTIDAGAGRNNIDISPTARNLDNILGSVTLKNSRLTVVDKLTLWDSFNTRGDTYTLTQQDFQRTHSQKISYDPGVKSIILNAGSGPNAFFVPSTSIDAVTRINAGGNVNSRISVGAQALATSGTLDNIKGTLLVDCNGGAKVDFWDNATVAGKSYQLTNNSLFRDGYEIDFLNATSASLRATAGDDVIKSLATNLYPGPTTSWLVDGGAGVNTVVGSDGFNQWSIVGANVGSVNGKTTFVQVQNLTGMQGDDMFTFKEAGSISGRVSGAAGNNTLNFAAVTGSLWVNAYEGGNVLYRIGAISGINYIYGNGFGTLQAGNTNNNWDLSDPILGKLSVAPLLSTTQAMAMMVPVGPIGTVIQPPVYFKGFDTLVGGNANDSFKFSNQVLQNVVVIFGAGGTNTLDFSAATRDLIVNLFTNTVQYPTAPGSSAGSYIKVYSFQNAYTGSGNDILVGNNLANYLSAGAGDDVLIGRDGSDTLIGGFGNDALVDGFTDYDGDMATLRERMYHAIKVIISDGWFEPTVYTYVYVNEVLTNGDVGTNGQHDFFSLHVHHDNSTDNLIGGAGIDTFYIYSPGSQDTNDFIEGERWL